jgi:carotenoid cleavage dioxygenase
VSSGTLPGGFAAHTKLDHATGELHAIAYFWVGDHVQHVVVDAAGNVTRTTDLPVADGPMMHDFALTGRYVVLPDLPVTFSLNAVSAGRELPYVWNPGHQARVGLLPRAGSSPVRWIEIEPCWVATWPAAPSKRMSSAATPPSARPCSRHHPPIPPRTTAT